MFIEKPLLLLSHHSSTSFYYVLLKAGVPKWLSLCADCRYTVIIIQPFNMAAKETILMDEFRSRFKILSQKNIWLK